MSRPLLAILLGLSIAGCDSAPEKIAENASVVAEVVHAAADDIQANAEETKEIAEFIWECWSTGIAPDYDPIQGIIDNQNKIIATTVEAEEVVDEAIAAIHENVGDVQPRQSQWATMFTWVSIAVVSLAVLFILWRSGILGIVGGFLRLGTSLIPKPMKTDAKFDAEAIYYGEATEQQKQQIAAKRAASRGYDFTFRKEHERLKEDSSGS